MPRKISPIYQLKISLDDTHPPIWRRVVVPASITLEKLHNVIQIVMGWEDYHLHMFELGSEIFGNPEDDEFGDLGMKNEKKFSLSALLIQEGQKLRYEYDFGDGWRHTLLLEKILPPEAHPPRPLCLKGKRACPPEDVGGVWGYEEFLETIADPKHEEHERYLEWIGGEFDPEAFDLDAVNQRLQSNAVNAHRETTWAMGDDDVTGEAQNVFLAAQQVTPPEYQAAENLPLRQDVVTFLRYLQDNKVVGTQATGNLPLKAVRGICAAFVNPPELDHTYGATVVRLRSEMDVFPLFFIHALTAIGRLVDGGMARRWVVTDNGQVFLRTTPPIQLGLLFYAWWRLTNWGITVPYMPQDFPIYTLRKTAGEHLLQLPLDRPLPFDLFADQLIRAAPLTWPNHPEHEHTMLHGIVEYAVARPLSQLGLLKLDTAPHPTLGEKYPQASALTLTALGKRLLETVRE